MNWNSTIEDLMTGSVTLICLGFSVALPQFGFLEEAIGLIKDLAQTGAFIITITVGFFTLRKLRAERKNTKSDAVGDKEK